MPKLDALLTPTYMLIDCKQNLLSYPFHLYLPFFFNFAEQQLQGSKGEDLLSVCSNFHTQYCNKTLSLDTLTAFLNTYSADLRLAVFNRNKKAYVPYEEGYLCANSLSELHPGVYAEIISQLYADSKQPVLVITRTPQTQLIADCLVKTLPSESFKIVYASPMYAPGKRPPYQQQAPEAKTLFGDSKINVTRYLMPHSQSPLYYLITDGKPLPENRYLEKFSRGLWCAGILRENLQQDAKEQIANAQPAFSYNDPKQKGPSRFFKDSFPTQQKIKEMRTPTRSDSPLQRILQETSNTPPRSGSPFSRQT